MIGCSAGALRGRFARALDEALDEDVIFHFDNS